VHADCLPHQVQEAMDAMDAAHHSALSAC
jgi:hypothetical protein